MKKITLTLMLLAAAVGLQKVQAQGTVWLNNYDSGKGIYINTVATAAPAGTFVQVLGGASAGSLSPIATVQAGNATIFAIQAGDINGNGPGSGSYFDKSFGIVSGVAAGATAFFQVRAWTGAATYAEALTLPGAFAAASTIWSQVTGTNPAPPATPNPAILALPGQLVLQPVPEPSTIALGVLGAGSLLFLRRKK